MNLISTRRLAVISGLTVILGLAVISSLAAVPGLPASEPLHERIDHLVEAKAGDNAIAPPATDAAFLRRVYLDFSGRIPSSVEARAFFTDGSPDKRARLIDHLLESGDYARHMMEQFHTLLMERRGDNKDWQKYLQDSFASNKPWDQMVREILKPDAQDEATRAAVFFYGKRLERFGANPVDFPALSNDVSRLFLGKNLKCAQCHDHEFIDDYKQADFQGLYAAFVNVTVKKDRGAGYLAVFEKPMKAKLEFISVFESTRRVTGPRFPGGRELEIPDANKTKGAKGAKKIATPFSPLALFAEEMPRADNELFTANIANRLWFLLMGRGIVHPLDLHHSDNPPSHPELLKMLADEFAGHRFDIRWFLKELALTRTYARTSLLPDSSKVSPPDLFLVAAERRLSAEQLLWSTLEATGESARVKTSGDDATSQEDSKASPGAEARVAGPTLTELRKGFVAAFANEAREPEIEIKASVKGALFLLNDDRLLQLLQPRPGNLVDRLSKIADSSELSDELFLSVLTRRPTREEVAEIARFLPRGGGPERTAAIGQMAWAMLASVEFYVNH